MTRQTANRIILNHIHAWIEAYPDFRFGQILFALHILEQDDNGHVIDIFNWEPDLIIKKIDGAISRMIEDGKGKEALSC